MSDYKILIVDDIIDNLKIMVSILEEYFENCQIYQTSDSTKALDICIKTLPDVVISDWKMPKLSGLELTKLKKEEPTTKNIPVIIATAAMISPYNLQKAMSAGATDFVIKPFNNIELIARVDSAVSIYRKHKKTLELKDKELAESTLHLVKNKEFASEIHKLLLELENATETTDNRIIHILNSLKTLTKSKIADDSLERFNIAFYSVHEHFNKNLISKFPNLTNNDLKLCAFLRLGMNTKDIASILYQTNDSVKVSRSRLRKKLGLDQSQNLQVFLSAF